MKTSCPICNSKKLNHVKKVVDFDYFQCSYCQAILIDPFYIDEVDSGLNLIMYDKNYWVNELQASKERAYSIALARMAEAFYYCRIPINKFLDIGTGPGYFLEAVAKYLPNNIDIFYAIENFPPPEEYQIISKNYIKSDLELLNMKFDAGICIEVIEHLTPKMLSKLFNDLAKISNHNALYIFNSRMPEYVLKEDIEYLDPINRGHIVSYSINAIKFLSKEFGFTVFPIKGKTWAFVLEFESKAHENENINDRIWSAVDHNLKILTDKDMGSVLKILGLETSRAYG